MIFKQIHTLPISPDWGKIALITAGVLIAVYVAYNAVKRDKLKIEPKPKLQDKIE